MPAPLLVAGIAAGATLGSSAINAMSQSNMNKKNRKWNEHMYGVQRRDALSDWAMQNEYDHPSAQMARLRAAGLNPNLVYGNGVTGNASGQVRTTDVKPWNPRAPQYDIGGAFSSALSAYYDTEIKQAQVDNLQKQNTVLTQDALLKAAQVINTTAQTGKTQADTESVKFDTWLKDRIKEISVDAAAVDLRKRQLDIEVLTNRDEREAALNSATIGEAMERILTMRANREKIPAEKQKLLQEIENLKKDATLKQLDIDLKEKGIQPGDAMWWRVIARALESSSGREYKPSVIGGHEKQSADSIRNRLDRFKINR